MATLSARLPILRAVLATNSDRESFQGIVINGWLQLTRPLGAMTQLYVGDRFNNLNVNLDGQRHLEVLSGCANIAANEPVFDGARFINFAGQALQMLNLGSPIAGAHDTIIVIDSAQQTAFVGGFGGRVPPTMSRFRGYRATLPLREATAFDRAAFRSATTVKLDERCDDIAVEAWHYDARTGRIFMTIGIDGHTDVMEVIDLPADVPVNLAA